MHICLLGEIGDSFLIDMWVSEVVSSDYFMVSPVERKSTSMLNVFICSSSFTHHLSFSLKLETRSRHTANKKTSFFSLSGDKSDQTSHLLLNQQHSIVQKYNMAQLQIHKSTGLWVCPRGFPRGPW